LEGRGACPGACSEQREPGRASGSADGSDPAPGSATSSRLGGIRLRLRGPQPPTEGRRTTGQTVQPARSRTTLRAHGQARRPRGTVARPRRAGGRGRRQARSVPPSARTVSSESNRPRGRDDRCLTHGIGHRDNRMTHEATPPVGRARRERVDRRAVQRGDGGAATVQAFELHHRSAPPKRPREERARGEGRPEKSVRAASVGSRASRWANVDRLAPRSRQRTAKGPGASRGKPAAEARTAGYLLGAVTRASSRLDSVRPRPPFHRRGREARGGSAEVVTLLNFPLHESSPGQETQRNPRSQTLQAPRRHPLYVSWPLVFHVHLSTARSSTAVPAALVGRAVSGHSLFLSLWCASEAGAKTVRMSGGGPPAEFIAKARDEGRRGPARPRARGRRLSHRRPLLSFPSTAPPGRQGRRSDPDCPPGPDEEPAGGRAPCRIDFGQRRGRHRQYHRRGPADGRPHARRRRLAPRPPRVKAGDAASHRARPRAPSRRFPSSSRGDSPLSTLEHPSPLQSPGGTAPGREPEGGQGALVGHLRQWRSSNH